MAYLNTSAGWVAPGEVSGWISPSEVSGWISPSEVSGWVSPMESGSNGWDALSNFFSGGEEEGEMYQGEDLGAPAINEQMSQAGGQKKSKGDDGMVGDILGAVVAPTFDAIKFWTGGSEIEQKKAEAMVADAEAKKELAKAQALMSLRTQPKGMNTNTLLLLGGGALVLFLVLR